MAYRLASHENTNLRCSFSNIHTIRLHRICLDNRGTSRNSTSACPWSFQHRKSTTETNSYREREKSKKDRSPKCLGRVTERVKQVTNAVYRIQSNPKWKFLHHDPFKPFHEQNISIILEAGQSWSINWLRVRFYIETYWILFVKSYI